MANVVRFQTIVEERRGDPDGAGKASKSGHDNDRTSDDAAANESESGAKSGILQLS